MVAVVYFLWLIEMMSFFCWIVLAVPQGSIWNKKLYSPRDLILLVSIRKYEKLDISDVLIDEGDIVPLLIKCSFIYFPSSSNIVLKFYFRWTKFTHFCFYTCLTWLYSLIFSEKMFSVSNFYQLKIDCINPYLWISIG